MTVCAACQKPLTLHLNGDDEDEDDEDKGDPSTSPRDGSYIDDDVHLSCGCHFHWQCLLDTSYELTSCPNCKANVISTDSEGTQQQLLCDLKNEGGLQEGLDILPILTEESYLRAYPEERKARAFLEFCAEGDTEAIVEMLNNGDDGELGTDSVTANDNILRYQDQLGSMSSALHVAIRNQRVEVAWLLLWLASNVNESAFPSEVTSAAREMGIVRSDQTGKVDIRDLKDAEGMTAYDRAAIVGGVWESWIKEGVFLKEPILKAT